MAHFVYPAGTPLGTVPSFYVVPSTEWQLVIQQLYAAINGDDGGTWAPGAFITVGGSGFQLTGTGHSLASGARLTVQSTGEIRLANGALLKADGTAGDIRLEVATNVATLTAETGTVIKLNAGGALDVYGSTTFKDTSGPGSATWESSTTATWLSGSAATFASGSTLNITGQALVRGQLTIKNSGGPGTLTLESGTTSNVAGTLNYLSTSTVSLAGTTTFSNSTWPQLSPARTITRGKFSLLPLTYYVDGASSVRSGKIFWITSIITNGPAATTELATVVGDESILVLEDLPIGATVTDVVLTTQGSGGSGVTLPTYRLVSWADTSSAGLTNESGAVTDGHSSGNWTATTEDTTVTPSGTTTITAGRTYGIKVTHPYDASATQMQIFACVTTLSLDVVKF